MSDLWWNKLFGAVLATGLVILGLRQVSDMVFTAGPPAKPGYAIAVQETAEGGAQPADVPPDWGTVLPTADVSAGQTVSTKCASCHNFVSGGPDMTGPNLYGVEGRKPGSKPGFAYSQAMVDEGNKIHIWDYEHLYEYLAAPQAYVTGTKMTFVGLKKREDRINLIAWLRTQGASPPPIPAPNPAAAAAGQAPASAQGSAPAPNGATTVPAAGQGAGANAPAAAGNKAPSQAQTSNPTGVGPASGAAATPSAVNDAPGGKKN